MNTPGLFPFVDGDHKSLKRRLEHMLSGVRIAPKIGGRWLAAASLFAVVAIAGVGFAQQGKQSSASAPEGTQKDTTQVAGEPMTPASPTGSAKGSPSNEDAASGTKKDSWPRKFSGRVSDVDGRPIGRAQIFVVSGQFSFAGGSMPMNLREVAKSDARGDFAFELNRQNFEEQRLGEAQNTAEVVAQAPGYGLASLALEAFDVQPVDSRKREQLRMHIDQNYGAGRFAQRTLKMSPEQLIHGRLVDLEGRPLANVLVSAESISEVKIEKLLEAFEKSNKRLMYQSTVPVQMSLDELQRFLTPVKTDSSGQFTFRGVGKDQLLTLVFQKEGVEAARIYVFDRTMQPTKLPQVEHYSNGYHDFYGGCDFTYTVGPAATVLGVVKDCDTGQPVPNTTVFVERLFAERDDRREQVRLFCRYIRAVSDAQGRFRIVGIPPGGAHVLRAVPPIQEPYLMAEKEISPKLDGSQGTIEIRVKKGLWYEGRLTDKASGEPVKAYVDHLALRSNPNKLDSIGLRQGWEMERYHTDSKGGYRTAGLPGPGVLLVRAVELDGYPRAIGGDKVPGYDASLDYIPTTPVGMPLANWNLIIQVDPPKTAATFHRNIVLDAGQMIPGRLVAADEKPLSDVQVVGETLNNNWWMPHPNANFQLRGYDGKGPRQLLFQASGGSLVGRHRQEGPAPKEIVVKLAPAVRVKGRLIEGESGVAIYCEQSTIGKSHVDVTTKDDGRFEIKGLMAGAVYKMYIANRPRSLSMKKNFNIDLRQAKPGDLLDLGDIGGEQSADLRKSPQVSPKNDSPESSRPMTIRGTVLRPDGRPASDAQVSSFRFHWRSGDKIRWEPLGTTQANDHGDFELPSKPGDGSGADNIFFFATANGFGCAFKGWFVDPPNSLVMKLVPDQPIHGRVLDLEGKPVAGARIRVVSITDSLNRTLGPWLEAVKSGVPRYTLGAHQRLGDFIKTIPGASGSTTADHEGRFTLQGLGAERVVDLSIESDSTAYTQVTIATRHMEPIIHAALPMSPGGLEIFGANFTKAVKPTRPIVGIVRDAQTGKLLEGVAIESSRLAGEFFAGQRRLTTTTNAQGRYRMVGMPKGNGNALIVVPNDDQPYFMREIVVPEMAGIEPVTVDVELHRGLWITGRVIDKDTGKPVPANVNYWPFLTNTHTSGLPEFGPARRMAGDASRYRTRPDGSFRIPGLPGRGLVGAVALAGHYRQGAGASEIRDVDREGRFRTYENQVRPSLKYPTTMKAIDPADGSQTVTCDLVCDHGETVRVTVLDPDGKPVRNCSTSAPAKNGKVQGLNSPFEITNLSLNVEQPLLIEQKDRKLAKFIKFTPKGQAPNSLTVQLEPCATVSGRLVDEDGFALKGIAIEPRFRRGGDYWPRLTTVVCNLDGRFECTSLPSGVDVDFYAEGAGIDVIATFGRMSVPAGKTIDLGDVKVKRRQ